MTEEIINPVYQHRETKVVNRCGAGGGVYGLAFIGAAIYFLQHATSFWNGVLGILKAIVWPAVVIYKLLEFLIK